MRFLTVCFSALLMTLLPSGVAQESGVDEETMLKRFQGALFEEEVNRDLDKAAAGYESVIAEFDKNRTVVATAVFRLAEVYREKDDKPRAIGLYRRLIRDFPEEKPLVKLSEGYLRGLGAEVPGALDPGAENVPEMTGVVPTIRTEEAKALAHAKATARESPDLLDHLGEDGNTLLSGAAAQSFLTVAGFLLDQGVEINGKIQRGSTALHLAAENGHLSMVKLLIERGAEVDRPNSLGRSPLHLAVARGHGSTVEFLMESGADADRMVSLFSGSDKALRKVWVRKVKNGELDGEDRPITGNALHLAILNDEKMVGFLLEKGVAQVAGGELGYTPLALALERKKWETALMLIDKGADVHAVTDDGKSTVALISDSVPGDQLGLLDRLLEADVDVNKADDLKRTALFEAVNFGNGNRVIEKLLAAGADPNVMDVFGTTPLLRAASRGKVESATILLKAGADPNVKSPQSNGAPVLSVLISTLFGEDVSAEQHQAVFELAQLMVDSGADINAVNESNETGIFLAKGESSGAIVDFYLKNGVNLSIESRGNGMAYRSLSKNMLATANQVPREVQLRVWRATVFPNLADRENRIWVAAPGNLRPGEIYLATDTARIAPQNSIRLIHIVSSRSDLTVAKPSDVVVWRGLEKVVPEDWDMLLRGGDVLEVVRHLEKGENAYVETPPQIQVTIGNLKPKIFDTTEFRDSELIDPAENSVFSVRKMGLDGAPDLDLTQATLIREEKSFTVNLEEKKVLWREGDELSIPLEQDSDKVMEVRRQGIFISRPEIDFIARVQRRVTELPELKNRYQLAGTILDFYIRGEQVLPHPDMERIVIRRINKDGTEERIPMNLSEISMEPLSNAVIISKYPSKEMPADETAEFLKDALKKIPVIDPESVRTLDERQNNSVLVIGNSKDVWPDKSIGTDLEPLMESAKLNQLSYKSVHVPFPPEFKLQWGDIIEIPSTQGSLEKPWIGFDSTMWFKLKRWAQVDVQAEYLTSGKWADYTLVPPQPLFQKSGLVWDRGLAEKSASANWRGKWALFEAVGNEAVDWNHFLVKRSNPDSTVMIDNPFKSDSIRFFSGDRVVLTPRVK